MRRPIKATKNLKFADLITGTDITTIVKNHPMGAEELLDLLEQEAVSSRRIALLRIRLSHESETDDGGIGLAATVVPLLTEALSAFGAASSLPTTTANATHGPQQFRQETYRRLHRVLKLHLQLVQRDSVLSEELGRQGLHALLQKTMMPMPVHCDADEELIQDLACEIAVASRPHFPLVTKPLTAVDVKARLPLVFDIAPLKMAAVVPSNDEWSKNASVTVLIQQVPSRQSAQVDVGFGMQTNHDSFLFNRSS